MAVFEPALRYVLQNEGSRYVDIKGDAGPTRYGITIQTLSAHLGRPATRDEVRDISLDTVTDIYRERYWKPVGGDLIELQALATLVFDCAVLCGPMTSLRMLQRVAHLPGGCRFTPALKKLTRSNMPEPERARLELHFLLEYQDYLVHVAQRPSKKMFLAGWLRRTQRNFDRLCAAAKYVPASRP